MFELGDHSLVFISLSLLVFIRMSLSQLKLLFLTSISEIDRCILQIFLGTVIKNIIFTSSMLVSLKNIRQFFILQYPCSLIVSNQQKTKHYKKHFSFVFTFTEQKLTFLRVNYFGSLSTLPSKKPMKNLVKSGKKLYFDVPLYNCANVQLIHWDLPHLFADRKHPQFHYYMAKRPVRSTRGQLPPHLRQETTPPKISRTQPEDEKQVLRITTSILGKEMQSKRKMNLLLNLKKYPFGRAIHFFFNLDDFPRAAGTVSYVVNEHNAFGHTYSKDGLMIKESRVGDVINRRLMGLPVNLTGDLPSRKQIKCKNVCYAYLFDIQDKKHNNDRIIFTIKAILKRLASMTNKQLESYDFIKKDNDLQQILGDTLALPEKQQLLQEKLKSLQARKEANRVNWQFEDTVLYYHALNQCLHNAVVELKFKLTEEYFYRFFFEKQQLQYQFHLSSLRIEDFLSQMISYYYKNVHSLSLSNVKNLVANFRLFLGAKDLSGRFLINYPMIILHFGKNPLLRSQAEFLLARRAFSMGQVQFYDVKMMVKKLFRKQLKLKAEKLVAYEQYYKNFRKRYEDICRFRKTKIDKDTQNSFTYPLLDQYLDEAIKKGNSSNFFKLSERIEITKKEFVFIMIYFWLCQCLANIQPYLTQFQDLLQIIGSDYYPKVCNPLVEAIGSPLSGLIFYVFEALNDLMNKNDPLGLVNTRFYLEHDEQTNVSMIWRGQEQRCLQQSEQENYEVINPNKKIKRM